MIDKAKLLAWLDKRTNEEAEVSSEPYHSEEENAFHDGKFDAFDDVGIAIKAGKFDVVRNE
jgi:hypothetical protein